MLQNTTIQSYLKPAATVLLAAAICALLTGCLAASLPVKKTPTASPAEPAAAQATSIPGEENSPRPQTSQPADEPAPAPPEDPPPSAWYTLYFSRPTPDGNASPINPPILAALLDTINGAKQTLDIAVLEINLDPISNALIAAARRGVQVRVVCDSDGLADDQQLRDLVNAGIPLVPDERQEIMHDKFMVVDGESVWTGSYNFTFNDTYRNDNNAILIRSAELARNYTAEFEEMFVQKKFGKDSPANTVYKLLNLDGSEVSTCFSPEDRCVKLLVGLVNGSQSSVRFMAYSFTDNAIGKAMLQRARAGVEVSGVFETRGSETEYSEYAYLKQNNVDVRLDGNPYNMHHKVIILDDETVVMGSNNFTNNGMNYNDENLLVLHDAGIAAQYLEEFRRVYGQASGQ